MKKNALFLLCFLPLLLFANNADKSSGETPWRYAIGARAYSNFNYAPEPHYNAINQQALEINFRFQPKKHHVVRVSTPLAIAFPVRASKSPLTNLQVPFNSYIFNNYRHYLYRAMDNQVTAQDNYNLFGLALGYDFDWYFGLGFSAFVGADIAYYYQQRTMSATIYTETQYIAATAYKTQQYDGTFRTHSFHAQPLLGLRYQLWRLMLEARAGWNVSMGNTRGNESQIYAYEFSEPIQGQYSFNSSATRREHPLTGNFIYHFAVYFTF